MATTDPQPDVCINCGYSLHTLDETRACPECGTSVLVSQTSSPPSFAERLLRRIPVGTRTVFVCGIGVLLLLIAWQTLTTGEVVVSEFCPQTLQFRLRRWFEIPIIRLRVSGDQVKVYDESLSMFLRDNGYIPTNTEPVRWYFLGGRRSDLEGWIGTARHVRCFCDDAQRMIDWTKTNPKAAAAIWPAILRDLRADELTAVRATCLIRFALDVKDSEDVKAALRDIEWMADEYLK